MSDYDMPLSVGEEIALSPGTLASLNASSSGGGRESLDRRVWAKGGEGDLLGEMDSCNYSTSRYISS
jgi:hypothetical protein